MKTAGRVLAAPTAASSGGLDASLALIALFLVIWSSAFAAAKFALVDCPPLILLCVRFLTAGAIMLALAWMLGGRPRIGWRDLGALVLLGAFNNAIYLAFTWSGMTTVSSGFAAVLVSANPILVALLAAPVLGERLTRVKLAGLLIGFAGVTIVLRSRLAGGLEGLDGTLLLVAGIVSLVVGTVLFKKLKPGGGVWVGNAVQCLAGGVLVLPAALLIEDPSTVRLTPGLIGGFLYLVVAVSIGGYAIWFHLLGRTTATAASALHFLMPPLGLLFGWLLLGEAVPPLDLVGVVPIAIGIYMVTRAAPARKGATGRLDDEPEPLA